MMDDTTKQILEIITNIQEEMVMKEDLERFATKEDLEEIRKEMATKEDLEEIRKEMATKEDLEEVRRELQMQISENTKAIERLTEQIQNMTGYAKEIDYLMERVSRLEKHVGIR